MQSDSFKIVEFKSLLKASEVFLINLNELNFKL